MRPRQIAAENLDPAGLDDDILIASMRPRQIAAENEKARFGIDPERAASMRPRQIAAENVQEAEDMPVIAALQ